MNAEANERAELQERAYKRGRRDGVNDSADRVAALEKEIEALSKDAERYRWIRSRKGLTLRCEPQPNLWSRIDGTQFSVTHIICADGKQFAPAEGLDATIDAAMAER